MTNDFPSSPVDYLSAWIAPNEIEIASGAKMTNAKKIAQSLHIRESKFLSFYVCCSLNQFSDFYSILFINNRRRGALVSRPRALRSKFPAEICLSTISSTRISPRISCALVVGISSPTTSDLHTKKGSESMYTVGITEIN